MALRDRQIGGIPLVWWQGFVATLIGAACVPWIAYHFWFPFFGIPEEFRIWIVTVSTTMYMIQCSGRVKQGTEQAQLFLGTYTGVSFRAGIYFLPRVPFPVIAFVIQVLFHVLAKTDVSKYLGWILEGSVNVASIIVKFASHGITSDGIRAALEGTLVFELEDAAVFLSQTPTNQDYLNLQHAVGAESEQRINQRVIAGHSARELMEGSYQGGKALTDWITNECQTIKNFGVSLARIATVKVDIQSKRIEKAFDAYQGREVMKNATNAAAVAFAEFVAKLPKGTSEEAALMIFNAERIEAGQPTVTMNMVKFK